MRVLKFGGKSLENSEKFEKIANFIKEIYKSERKIIVVVSAIGYTTDNLVKLSKDFVGEGGSESEQALLLSTGEIQSAALFSMKLLSLGVPAKPLYGENTGIITKGNPLSSIIEYVDKSKIQSVIEGGTVAVVAGFQGVNGFHEMTTLGRGGSDTTAVALAAAFHVSAEIYSDFDGVFAGDPRNGNFKKLPEIGYNQMLSMSKSGAKVIDSRATAIAKNFNIKIISKSAAMPKRSGTVISRMESDVISINKIENLSKITICFSNLNRLQKLSQIVLKSLSDIKFYNFGIFDGFIEFYIESKNYPVILSIARSLKLLD